jgi:hypothetical protein
VVCDEAELALHEAPGSLGLCSAGRCDGKLVVERGEAHAVHACAYFTPRNLDRVCVAVRCAPAGTRMHPQSDTRSAVSHDQLAAAAHDSKRPQSVVLNWTGTANRLWSGDKAQQGYRANFISVPGPPSTRRLAFTTASSALGKSGTASSCGNYQNLQETPPIGSQHVWMRRRTCNMYLQCRCCCIGCRLPQFPQTSDGSGPGQTSHHSDWAHPPRWQLPVSRRCSNCCKKGSWSAASIPLPADSRLCFRWPSTAQPLP